MRKVISFFLLACCPLLLTSCINVGVPEDYGMEDFEKQYWEKNAAEEAKNSKDILKDGGEAGTALPERHPAEK